MVIGNKFIIFIVSGVLFISFSLIFSAIYAENNSNIINSVFNKYKIDYFLLVTNNYNGTTSKYGENKLPYADVCDNGNIDNKILNVTLDVFSGRPDPNWILTKDQTSNFLKNISRIKPMEKVHDNPDKVLGYRGFIVEEKSIKDEPLKRFEIYNGVIKVVTNELSYVLEDKDYQIEKWLLQNAYIHVDNSLFNFVKEEIKNR